MTKFDVVVIGSGPGGYVCAIRCSQLGFKTALVEKYNSLGGTCLNVGCIPSKSLLDSSHHYYDAKNHFQTHGINFDGNLSIDFDQMISRKKSVVDQTTKGIDFLMKKNNINVLHGHGSFVDNETIRIEKDGDSDLVKFDKAVIATGSKPALLPFVNIDKKRIITSTEALDLKEIPKKLLIIGAGVIGLELGQVYSRLGSHVEIIEYSDKITPFMDSAVSKELIKIFKKQKIKFYLSHEVKNIENIGPNVIVDALNPDSKKVTFEGDYCLVSVGRRAYTDGLGLENIGIIPEKNGKINVNEKLQTKVENIYAIGDVIKGPMLAHKAEEEGVLVAEIFSNQKPHIDYNLIPNVIYTWPEVASVGKTEEQLKKEGINYKKGQFPMRALGRSRASMDLDGFVKILAEQKTDEILGVHIVGARAADLIAEAVTAMEFRASAEDVSRMSHSHPTYAEAIKEAALAATEDRPLHI